MSRSLITAGWEAAENRFLKDNSITPKKVRKLSGKILLDKLKELSTQLFWLRHPANSFFSRRVLIWKTARELEIVRKEVLNRMEVKPT